MQHTHQPQLANKRPVWNPHTQRVEWQQEKAPVGAWLGWLLLAASTILVLLLVIFFAATFIGMDLSQQPLFGWLYLLLGGSGTPG